ncbi:MAG TPA: STAS domain-containing protein [Solirubrobacteraceae bacterium]|nr:STAS domain-containing protein [Solirubrobacteraceae bacterium]
MSDEVAEQRDGLRAADVLHVGHLTVRSERVGVVYAICAEGELDLATAAQLERELKHAESSDALTIVLDLSGLQFIDSTGVRLIIQADARSRANSNRLTLLRGSAAVQRVFELTGIVGRLPFAD